MSDKEQLPGKNRRYIDSFFYAFKGVRTVFQEERNMRIHVSAAIIVLFLSLFLPMSVSDWLWISLAIFLVLVMEIWNTVIENLVDLVTKKYNPLAKKIKDMAAAAVLLSTIFSIVIGTIILLPKIIQLFF